MSKPTRETKFYFYQKFYFRLKFLRDHNYAKNIYLIENVWSYESDVVFHELIFGQFLTDGSLFFFSGGTGIFFNWARLLFDSGRFVESPRTVRRTGTGYFVPCALIYRSVILVRFAILYFWWLWNISGKASSSFWKTNIFFGLLLKMLKSWLLKWRNV